MAHRAINITARILFFLGGVVSALVAVFYAMLRGSDLPSQRDWVIFTVVLGLVGVANVLAAIFPGSWTARIYGVKDKSSLFSRPLRMLGIFAVICYLLAVGFFLTPRQWNLSGYLWTYVLCPTYIVRQTLDPSPVNLFLILAPIEAALGGAIGSAVGLVASRDREQRLRRAEHSK